MTTEDIVRSVPKVLLHDHLDGGLRPQTIIEIAKDTKYNKLPTKDAGELERGFTEALIRAILLNIYKDLNIRAL